MPRASYPSSKSTDRLFKVGAYAFCALDSVEREDRDFTVEVFSDRSCSWIDESERLRRRKDDYLYIRAFYSASSKTELQDEEQSFRYDGYVSEGTYSLIVEKEACQALGGEASEELCSALDRALAPDFWRINERLRTPLTRLKV